jgi:signal transduction histidine kinase
MTSSAERKFRTLSQVVAAVTALVPLERRLKDVVDVISAGLEVDLCAVLLLGPDHEGLRVAAVNDAALLRDPQAYVALDGLMGEGKGCRCPAERLAGLLSAGFLTGSPQVASWPLRDENFLYGFLCLGRAGLFKPPADLLEAVTHELAATVRASRHYEMAKRQVSELNVLFEVGRWISRTIELDELLTMVVAITPKLVRAKACAIGLIDRESGQLRVASTADGGEVRLFRQTGDGSPESLSQQMATRLEGGPKPQVCVPLAFKSDIEGHLCVYGAHHAVEGDTLLSGIAGIISSTLENAIIFRKVGELAERNQRMVRLLSTFYEFSQAVMTPARFEDRARITLRALTIPQGLRFGRAMLMLVDDDGQRLSVKAAMAARPGAAQKPEAGLADYLTCRDCLAGGEDFPEAEGFEVSLETGGDVFAGTVLEGRRHLVNDPTEEPRVSASFIRRFGALPFATVPIKARGRIIGLIYVDHGPPGEKIQERDLKALGMLANLAGLAIDNAMLYEYVESTNAELKMARERLLETEKLAALGELAAGMAHEIRNPLVSIGGFTRRVDRTLPESSPLKPYLSVIINEVEKLERTLGEILTFSGEGQDHFAYQDLNRIVEEALGLLKREFEETDIEIVRDYGQIDPAFCDGRQVKHVFFNLFLNAKQAMGDRGRLVVRTGTEPGEPPRAWCEVSDTGTGIPAHLLHNIFNPFFTTKDQGSGLGLSIAHKIMTRHRGEITVANKPGAGAAFTVKLPFSQAESIKEEAR